MKESISKSLNICFLFKSQEAPGGICEMIVHDLAGAGFGDAGSDHSPFDPPRLMSAKDGLEGDSTVLPAGTGESSVEADDGMSAAERRGGGGGGGLSTLGGSSPSLPSLPRWGWGRPIPELSSRPFLAILCELVWEADSCFDRISLANRHPSIHQLVGTRAADQDSRLMPVPSYLSHACFKRASFAFLAPRVVPYRLAQHDPSRGVTDFHTGLALKPIQKDIPSDICRNNMEKYMDKSWVFWSWNLVESLGFLIFFGFLFIRNGLNCSNKTEVFLAKLDDHQVLP